jgi:hypothetical protein
MSAPECQRRQTKTRIGEFQETFVGWTPGLRQRSTGRRSLEIRAWALKQAAMALYDYIYIYQRPARKHFRWWHGWAVRSRPRPMIEVARMLKRRLENIITYLRHPVTNAGSESINSRIQWVKYTARGFRNKRNFQIPSTSTVEDWSWHPDLHYIPGRAQKRPAFLPLVGTRAENQTRVKPGGA